MNEPLEKFHPLDGRGQPEETNRLEFLTIKTGGKTLLETLLQEAGGGADCLRVTRHLNKTSRKTSGMEHNSEISLKNPNEQKSFSFGNYNFPLYITILT